MLTTSNDGSRLTVAVQGRETVAWLDPLMLPQVTSAVPDPSTLNAHMKVIQKAYSGFVHAASPQIMDLYGGRPPGWNLRSMRGTPLEGAHLLDLRDGVYRGLCGFSIAAGALDEDIHREATEHVRAFARFVGIGYHPSNP